MRRIRVGRVAAIVIGAIVLLCTNNIESRAEGSDSQTPVMTKALDAPGTQTVALAETQVTAEQTGTADTEAVLETPEAVQKPDPTESAWLKSCVVTADGQISISGDVQGTWSDPQFYDNYLYLFELKPYQDSLEGRKDYAAWITKGDALSFFLPANLGKEDDRLYSSFVVAVYDGETYKQISNRIYVTNPELLAKNKNPYPYTQSKKGLMIELRDDMLADAMELGVKHVIVNIPFDRLLGEGIDYVYDGKTYHFNKGMLASVDQMVRKMSEKSMNVTAVLLNSWNPATPQLYYPGVTKQSKAAYYGFNASTKEGCETIKAMASFLADRYSSLASPYGKITNWIIGNEVTNQYWNYMGNMDLNQYAKEYERAFRVFYTAIKSTNQSDRLFFSTDYFWNSASTDGPYTYKGRDFITAFAENVKAGGDMDWGLAYHPYPMPMTEPEFWDDGAGGQVTQDASTPILNLCNLHVLTDYMQNLTMRKIDGTVRHIILSEQGFTSTSATRGEVQEQQAAAIAYAYYLVDSNPYIDAFIMSRQVDAPLEANASQTYGLWKCDMSKPNDIVPTMRKKSWIVYKDIDIKSRTLETTEFAKSILGISKWSDVIPNFRWRNLEK